MSDLLQILVLAGVAVFVAFRLYGTFGQQTGHDVRDSANVPPPSADEGPSPAIDASPPEFESQDQKPIFTGPAAADLEDIYEIDNSFTVPSFLEGSARAYEMIVTAFNTGDRDTLKMLLTDTVYVSYDEAIKAREKTDGKALEFSGIFKQEIAEASLSGSQADIIVSYQAEMLDETTIRKTKELWTFTRDLHSSDPTWRLSGVALAA